jgi:hypothetical protein
MSFGPMFTGPKAWLAKLWLTHTMDWNARRYTALSKYVVYDPPASGLPYIAVLFQPDARPRVFIFQTSEEATTFLTGDATAQLSDQAPQQPF